MNPKPLVPRAPLRLLEELALLSAGPEGTQPLVTLHLLSGRDVQGRLLALAEGVALLQLQTSDRFTVNVTHVPVANLEALTVHDATRLEQVPGDVRVPGKLEVQRAIASTTERLRSAGASFTLKVDDLNESALEPVFSALGPLETAFLTILREELGVQALQGISSVRLTVRQQAQVLKQDGTLEIQVAQPLRGRPDTPTWQTHLERVL